MKAHTFIYENTVASEVNKRAKTTSSESKTRPSGRLMRDLMDAEGRTQLCTSNQITSILIAMVHDDDRRRRRIRKGRGGGIAVVLCGRVGGGGAVHFTYHLAS